MVHNHLKGFWPLVDICLGLFSQVPIGYKMILLVLYRYPETTMNPQAFPLIYLGSDSQLLQRITK